MGWTWHTTLTWFALGAIGCNVATVFVLVGRGIRFQPALRLWRWLVNRGGLALAAVAAAVATVGSLALSELGPYEPCRYCWFQRIAMYPLALLLVVAWFSRDRKVWRYAVGLASVGLIISSWHYLVQRFPNLESAGSCDVANPCTLTLTWQFRFISIPYMAGSVFALVLALLVASAISDRQRRP